MVKESLKIANRIVLPIKGRTQRLTFVGLIAIAFCLMFIGKVDILMIERMRTTITDAAAPILEVVFRPISSASQATQKLESIWGIWEENELLRKENTYLSHWRSVAAQLKAENNNLRELMNFVPDPSVAFITGRVIADTGAAFAHSLLLNAGSRNGIVKGQAVLTGAGLVGRIAGVGRRSSRIILITDLNSRIPVFVGDGRTRAILAGDNTNMPRLIHLTPDNIVTVGDMVITSGHAGAFPVGIAVGIVSHSDKNGVTVQPFVRRQKIELVRVVDFGLSGILKAQPIEERPVAIPSNDGVFQLQSSSKPVSR